MHLKDIFFFTPDFLLPPFPFFFFSFAEAYKFLLKAVNKKNIRLLFFVYQIIIIHLPTSSTDSNVWANADFVFLFSLCISSTDAKYFDHQSNESKSSWDFSWLRFAGDEIAGSIFFRLLLICWKEMEVSADVKHEIFRTSVFSCLTLKTYDVYH